MLEVRNLVRRFPLRDEPALNDISFTVAAGDCIGGLAQVAKAVSDGAQAGIAMHKYLKSIKS